MPKTREDRPEQIKALLVWVAEGQSVRSYCQKPGTPCVQAFYNWRDSDLVFAQQLRHAQATGCDVIAQECLQIADDATDENVRVARLRIHTRLQLLARWAPAVYGDKIQISGDGVNPIRLSDDEAMSAIMKLVATAKARQLRDPKNRIS
jgi:hypothetical protein